MDSQILHSSNNRQRHRRGEDQRPRTLVYAHQAWPQSTHSRRRESSRTSRIGRNSSCSWVTKVSLTYQVAKLASTLFYTAVLAVGTLLDTQEARATIRADTVEPETTVITVVVEPMPLTQEATLVMQTRTTPWLGRSADGSDLSRTGSA